MLLLPLTTTRSTIMEPLFNSHRLSNRNKPYFLSTRNQCRQVRLQCVGRGCRRGRSSRAAWARRCRPYPASHLQSGICNSPSNRCKQALNNISSSIMLCSSQSACSSMHIQWVPKSPMQNKMNSRPQITMKCQGMKALTSTNPMTTRTPRVE